MKDKSDHTLDDQLAEAAALWVARMQSSDATLLDQEEFEAWLSEDEQHLSAFEEMQRLWSDLKDIPIPQERLEALRKARRNAKAGIASAVVAIGVSIGAYQVGSFDRWMSDHYTSVGEVQLVKLEDGSTVHLNTDTAIVVDFDDQRRRVKLLRGEAYFDVTSNKLRPFIVESGDFTAKAVGTQYTVKADGFFEAADAQVLEGLVEVRNDTETVLVKEGQIARLGADNHLKVKSGNVEQLASWRNGKLVFSKRTLADVTATLSRYRNGKIIVMGEALGRQKVSGVFDLKNTDQALNILSQSLSLKVTRLTDMLVIVRAK